MREFFLDIWLNTDKLMPTLWKMRHPDFYDKPNQARALIWIILMLLDIGFATVSAQWFIFFTEK